MPVVLRSCRAAHALLGASTENGELPALFVLLNLLHGKLLESGRKCCWTFSFNTNH